MDNQYPDFCQEFFPENNSEMMPIPNAFLRSLHNGVTQKTILESSAGRLWHVEICKIEGQMHFYNGWNKFTIDDPLEVGSLITFSFNGNNTFKFQIFEPNGNAVMEAHEEEEYEESDSIAKEEEEDENKHD